MSAPAVRRPVLGAHISGVAAVWVLRQIKPATLLDSARHFRSTGRPDVSRILEQAVAEIAEAAAQWEQRCAENASADGNAEMESTETATESESVVDTTAAAGLIGVSERRVRQLLDDGLLDGRKVGRQWLVERDSIENFRTDRRLAG